MAVSLPPVDAWMRGLLNNTRRHARKKALNHYKYETLWQYSTLSDLQKNAWFTAGESELWEADRLAPSRSCANCSLVRGVVVLRS
jgi:hypothetical protein